MNKRHSHYKTNVIYLQTLTKLKYYIDVKHKITTTKHYKNKRNHYSLLSGVLEFQESPYYRLIVVTAM